MNRSLVYVAAIVVVALSILVYSQHVPRSIQQTATTTTEHVIEVNGNEVRVSTASTPAERQQGLSGRSGLAPDEGMLFIFETEGDYAFWMKDMRFSIDILWIDSTGKIVYIAPSVSPDTYPTAFDPHQNAKYVLELPAGYTVAHHVKVGDTIQI